MEKIDVATKYHDIVGMLDTHLNQKEVDVMINGVRSDGKYETPEVLQTL